MEDEIRSPTIMNNLRVLTKGYLTDKAAEFKERFEEGKYQAAAYIKDTSDAVFNFAQHIGILTGRDALWYSGDEENEGIFPRAAEAVTRARVDGELVQDEVMRRIENLVSNMLHSFHYRLNGEAQEMAVLVLNEYAERVRKATANREKAPGHR